MSENAMMVAPAATDLERASAGYQALLDVLTGAGQLGLGLLKNVQTPLDALALADAGAAFGMTPLTALRSFHMVDGKPVLAADRMAGLCLQHPACDAFYPEVSDDTRCVYVGRRRQRDGQVTEMRIEWTIKRAQAAGAAGKSVWKQYPAAMLRARASSELARALFPDAMAGIYTAEELERTEPARTVRVDARPAQAQHPAPVDEVPDAEVEEALPALHPRLAELVDAIDPSRSGSAVSAVLWYLASRVQQPAAAPTLDACEAKVAVSDAAWAKTRQGMAAALRRRMDIVGGLQGAGRWLRALPEGCPALVHAQAAMNRHADLAGAGGPSALLGIALAVAEERTTTDESEG